jgi:hypothetical protein
MFEKVIMSQGIAVVLTKQRWYKLNKRWYDLI